MVPVRAAVTSPHPGAGPPSPSSLLLHLGRSSACSCTSPLFLVTALWHGRRLGFREATQPNSTHHLSFSICTQPSYPIFEPIKPMSWFRQKS